MTPNEVREAAPLLFSRGELVALHNQLGKTIPPDWAGELSLLKDISEAGAETVSYAPIPVWLLRRLVAEAIDQVDARLCELGVTDG